MDNEMKNRDDSLEIEFEIPDISDVSEALGISTDIPTDPVRTNEPDEVAQKAEADAEWALPTADDHAKPKRKRKSSTAKKPAKTKEVDAADGETADKTPDERPLEESVPSSGNSDAEADDRGSSAENEAADESGADKDNDTSSDPTEADVISSSSSDTDESEADKTEERASDCDVSKEAGNDDTAGCEAAEEISNDDTARCEAAEEEGEKKAEDCTDACGASPRISGEPIPEDNASADNGATDDNGDDYKSSEHVAERAEPSDDERFPDTLDDEYEKDAVAEGEFVPREYKFPDNALSPALPEQDDSLVIDLLGDPLTDENYVSHEMQPPRASEAQDTPVENDGSAPKGSEESYNPDKPRRIDVIFDFVELVIFTLVAVLFVTTFFVKHAVVEGNSMYDTLYPNDILIISDLFYEPSYGDIVVVEDYTLEREDMRKPLVKRVIATEGQLVKVTRDAIYVNSVPLDEPYVFTDNLDFEYSLVPGEPLRSIPGFFANDEYYTFVVPEGEIFVMGDHRNNSTDSRDVGTIRTDAILGRALFRIYPFVRFGFIDG